MTPSGLGRGGSVQGREAKDRLYEQFSRTAKAMASPHRIEVLELLAQGERTVEALATAAGMAITNTSAHLQVLRRAGLVETRKEGTKVYYRLSGNDVAAALMSGAKHWSRRRKHLYFLLLDLRCVCPAHSHA